jgi:bidirectional [NiFe] hydrogenase diaphorase subunit
MITLTLNGKQIQVQPGRTLLEAAREHGVWIPTLCYHEALEPSGGCRGPRLVAACSHPCQEGISMRTNTPMVSQARRVAAELLLARAGEVPFIRELAASLGVKTTPYHLPADDCVLCARCVRACREIVGVGALSMAGRGSHKEVTPPFHISSADCIECATCVLVCPTGAIRLEDIIDRGRSVHHWPTQYARHACRLCDYHADEWPEAGNGSE